MTNVIFLPQERILGDNALNFITAMTKKTFYFIILLIGIRNLTNAQELPLYITADQKRNNNFLLEITNYSYTSRGDDEICYTNLTMYSNPNRGFEYSSQ